MTKLSWLAALLATSFCSVSAVAQPQAPAAETSEEAGAISPQAAVEADNEAFLILSLGEKPRDQLIEEVKHASSGAPDRESDFRYDAGGTSSGSIVSRFDANGRLQGQEFFDGAGRALGRVRRVAPKGKAAFLVVVPPRASKPLHLLPRATRLQSGGAALATYAYDRAGQLVSSRHAVPASTRGATIEYVFAADGRPTRKTLRLPQNITATALYNARGKRTGQQIVKPGAVSIRAAYRYNARGFLQNMDLRAVRQGESKPLLVQSEFRYDKSGRFQEQIARSGNETLLRSVIKRDDGGNVADTTTYFYRDGKMAGYGTVRTPSKDTFESLQYDAAGKLRERTVAAYLHKGRAPVVQREEIIAEDGSKRVTIFHRNGNRASVSYLRADGTVEATERFDESGKFIEDGATGAP